MEIIGLDLHHRERQLAITADDGTIPDRRIATSRERFTAVLGAQPRARTRYIYKVDSVHFVTPTDDNRRQAEGMRSHGIFRAVQVEIGEIIVAEVDTARIKELVGTDGKALDALIGGVLHQVEAGTSR